MIWEKMLKMFLSWSVVLVIGSSWTYAGDLPVGSIRTVKGPAAIERQQQNLTAKIGDKIFIGDTLVTSQEGSLGITLKDNTLLSLGPDTRFTVKEFLFSPAEGKFSLVTRLFKGTVAVLSGIIAKLSPDSVRLETPVGNVGIRGTKFAVKIEESSAEFQKADNSGPVEIKTDFLKGSPLGKSGRGPHEPS
ncbi:MAG: hypothetical protein C0407_00150 [Desulfobacca sp.]|nr:hypothetical protein [Desulfobacca sp.]